MTPETYKLIHIGGVLLLFFGFGGIFAAGKGSKAPALFLAMHGIGLIAVLVAGIGFAHKSNLGWPNWMIAKIGGWVLLAALPTLVRRGLLPRALAIVLLLGIGAGAAWIGLTNPKPF